MKDLLRLKTSLNEEIETILNAQIKVEAHSSSVYLAMSAWCDDQGYDFSATFFAEHSEDDRKHMMKLFNHVNDRGGKSISPEINNNTTDLEYFRSIVEEMHKQQKYVTQILDIRRGMQ